MQEMNTDLFALRLTKLREFKNVSAREMSLSLGQNPGYINSIETGKSLPSMNAFFDICDYLNLSPKDFFDIEAQNPDKVNTLVKYVKLLNDKQLDSLTILVEDLTKKG